MFDPLPRGEPPIGGERALALLAADWETSREEDEAFLASLTAGTPALEDTFEEDAADWASRCADHPFGLAPGDVLIDPTTLLAAVDDEWLAAQAPGPELAWRLDAADPHVADDYGLVEIIAAWTRLISWAQAGAADAARLLGERASQQVPDTAAGTDRAGIVRVHNVAAPEIATRLRVSRYAAQTLIDTGRALAGPLGQVGQALCTGAIDLPRARAFVTALTDTPAPTVLAVQERVLPTAPDRTARQVAADIAAALITVDPDEADARHARARSTRRVTHPSPLPDGMAGLWCVLPAPDATALDLALDAGAIAARADGDPRTRDHLRADILAALAHSALATGTLRWPGTLIAPVRCNCGPAGDAATRPADGASANGAATKGPATNGASFRLADLGRRAPQIRVTIPLAVLLPDAAPAEPSTAPGAGRGADRVADRRLERVGNRGEPGPDPGIDPRRNAREDLREDAREDSGADRTEEGVDPARFDPLDRAIDPDHVAHLDGYGPLTPAVARALALGGTWSRLITDPETGIVRDIGRARYRPPADLADLVRARDRTCTRPGCAASASSCDLDHTIPWQHGGTTAEHNLAALCPADHALKTAGAYSVTQVGPGTYDFRLPSGHVYRRNADGTTTQMSRSDGAQPDDRPAHEDVRRPSTPSTPGDGVRGGDAHDGTEQAPPF